MDPIISDDKQEYEIERIVYHKKTRNRTVYQVKYKGYNAMEDSWLKGKGLANALDLL